MTTFDKILTNVTGALNTLHSTATSVTMKLIALDSTLNGSSTQTSQTPEVLQIIHATVIKVSDSTDLLHRQLEGLSLSTLEVREKIACIPDCSNRSSGAAVPTKGEEYQPVIQSETDDSIIVEIGDL